MNDYLDDFVRRTIARHLGVRMSAVQPFHHFRRDLRLQPLDIVLVALAIEDVEDVELPIDELESVATVSDLTRLVRAADEDRRQAEKPLFVPIYRRGLRARRALLRHKNVA